MAFRNLSVLSLLIMASEAAGSIEEVEGEIFAGMDKNKDGYLSLEEYAAPSDEEGHDISPTELAEAKKYFDALDEDRNGQLSLAEMNKQVDRDTEAEDENDLAVVEDAEVEDESEEQDVDNMDEEEDAALDESEVAAVEESTEGEASKEELEGMDAAMAARHIMEDLDKDKDGHLSFEEYESEQHVMYEDMEEEEKKQTRQELRGDFDKVDQDQNGLLSIDELQALTTGDDADHAVHDEV